MNELNQDFLLSHKQTEAWEFLFSDNIEEVLFGGAKGGGKTIEGCYAAVAYAQRVLKLCSLKEVPKYPHLIGFLGRKRSVDFTKTTLETWKKFINSQLYEYNDQKKEIVLFGGLFKYHCGGMDDENNIQKFNSAEYGFIFIDQAEELDRDDAGMLRATLGRAKINDISIPQKIIWTANPAICFLKEDFLSKDILSTRKYIKALPSDNEFIDTKKYIANLQEAYKHRPELIRAYIEGDWEGIQGEGFLLSQEDCQKSIKLELPIYTINQKTIVTNDPAWLGENADEIVHYVLRNNRVIDSGFYNNKDTVYQAAKNVEYANQYKTSAIVIDAIGIGAGVFDNCNKLKPVSKVIAINSSKSAGQLEENEDKRKEKENKFFNTRAEMWWEASESIKDGQFILPNDEKLINQLCSVKYEIRNGKIKIEDKKDIKARLGESPNRADAMIQGIWAIKKVKPDSSIQTNSDWKNKQFPASQRMMERIQKRRH